MTPSAIRLAEGADRGEQLRWPGKIEKARGRERQNEADRHDTTRRGERGFERDDHKPHGGERRDSAGRHADSGDQRRERADDMICARSYWPVRER